MKSIEQVREEIFKEGSSMFRSKDGMIYIDNGCMGYEITFPNGNTDIVENLDAAYNIVKSIVEKKSVIKSVGNSDKEILTNISKLYLDEKGFDCDFTYSKGNFYKEFPKPKFRFDLFPQTEDTQAWADVRYLPIKDGCVGSILCDLPFAFSVHGRTLESVIAKRFSMFHTQKDFEDTYKGALSEFHRVLKPQGLVAVKTQDYSDSRFYDTHVWICNWAKEIGFKVMDLFIYMWTKGRIWNPNLVQRVSRKYHSYYWIFKKIRGRNNGTNKRGNI